MHIDNRGAVHAAGFVLPNLNAARQRAAEAGLSPQQIVARVLAEAHVSLFGANPLKAAKDSERIVGEMAAYEGCQGCFANGFTAGMMIGIQAAMRAVELRAQNLVESSFGG